MSKNKRTKGNIGIPKEDMSLEDIERYNRAVELHEYRRNRVSTQLSVKEIFVFLKEWDEARMKIKNAGGW